VAAQLTASQGGLSFMMMIMMMMMMRRTRRRRKFVSIMTNFMEKKDTSKREGGNVVRGAVISMSQSLIPHDMYLKSFIQDEF
jgi:preprotein translocase subunit YajC